MEVRFIGNVTVRGVEYADGSTGEVEASVGKRLIAQGIAEATDVAEPEKEVPPVTKAKGVGKLFNRKK